MRLPASVVSNSFFSLSLDPYGFYIYMELLRRSPHTRSSPYLRVEDLSHKNRWCTSPCILVKPFILFFINGSKLLQRGHPALHQVIPPPLYTKNSSLINTPSSGCNSSTIFVSGSIHLFLPTCSSLQVIQPFCLILVLVLYHIYYLSRSIVRDIRITMGGRGSQICMQ